MNVLLQREELVTADEDLVTRLEGSRDNALLGLDGEVHLVDGTEDLVNLTDLGLLRELVSSNSVR